MATSAPHLPSNRSLGTASSPAVAESRSQTAETAPILYRVDDAAKAYATSRMTIYRLIAQGKLRPIRFGSRGIRVSRSELERFAKELESKRD